MKAAFQHVYRERIAVENLSETYGNGLNIENRVPGTWMEPLAGASLLETVWRLFYFACGVDFHERRGSKQASCLRDQTSFVTN